MARIPDKHEHQRRFMELDLKDRREIARAVNRGRAVANRRHAVFAVGVARRQQRFWRWAWLLGPVLGLAQLPFVELEAALFNIVVGTLVLLAMSGYWLWRAKKAEQANLALVDGKRGGGPARKAPKGHLPGEEKRAPRAADDADDEAARPAGPHGTPPRPPQPRRKKRRR